MRRFKEFYYYEGVWCRQYREHGRIYVDIYEEDIRDLQDPPEPIVRRVQYTTRRGLLEVISAYFDGREDGKLKGTEQGRQDFARDLGVMIFSEWGLCEPE